ncbi:MAG: RluA family pseudouridine synthase [Acidaminococcaceae bacterium]|jgi:23S rRNA pseudouridine1911/1915/1917 synthase|nr:RluA family pseudouridine synthase [Acidaminococcaceae bacterium]
MEHLKRGIPEAEIKADQPELEEDLPGETGTAKTLAVEAEAVGQRTDVYLAAALGSTRSAVQHLLEAGLVTRKGKPVAAHYKLRQGDVLAVFIPTPQPLAAQPENIPLDIIYEDEDVVVVNKPRGMVVHPAAGNYTGTLVNALLYHCKHLSGINGVIRPGIVHRLDKDTSGIMIAAKNDVAHVSLSHQIQNKTARRSYLAIVRGNVKTDSGTITTQIARDKDDRKKMAVVKEGGREAITEYQVLERFGKYTIVRCLLKTGRTHQIRVHLEYLGYPLVGDPKYSPMKVPFNIKGQALHSQTLDFIHPRTGQALHFEAPLPADMQTIITRLHNGQFT